MKNCRLFLIILVLLIMGCGDSTNDSTTDTTETDTNTPAESTIISSMALPFKSNLVTYDAMDKMAFGHMGFLAETIPRVTLELIFMGI